MSVSCAFGTVHSHLKCGKMSVGLWLMAYGLWLMQPQWKYQEKFVRFLLLYSILMWCNTIVIEKFFAALLSNRIDILLLCWVKKVNALFLGNLVSMANFKSAVHSAHGTHVWTTIDISIDLWLWKSPYHFWCNLNPIQCIHVPRSKRIKLLGSQYWRQWKLHIILFESGEILSFVRMIK